MFDHAGEENANKDEKKRIWWSLLNGMFLKEHRHIQIVSGSGQFIDKKKRIK